MSEIFLNVSSTMSRSRANGPGVRAVIWVQGCTIGCRGCYSASTHLHEASSLHPPSEIADWLQSIPDIEGVTFSGGEPFEQAAAVLETINSIRENMGSDFSVFVYTGYEIEFLRNSNDRNVHDLLNAIDILSAGPFDYKLRDETLLWRGSSNQSLHFLSNRYNAFQIEEWSKISPLEEITLRSDSIDFTGFVGPKSKMLKAAEQIASR